MNQFQLRPFIDIAPSSNPYKKFNVDSKCLEWIPNALNVAKRDRYDMVNQWREARSFDKFAFLGKLFSCDRLSRSDIDGINGYVSLTGQFPTSWFGKWKSIDNSYIDIPDVATWRAFYSSMIEQGQQLFLQAQSLKAQISDCATVDEVLAVVVE